MTGTIYVSDGASTYEGMLDGDWTPEQIRDSFMDGYNWGDAEPDASFTLRIKDDDGNILDYFLITRGSHYDSAATPHVVEWVG